MVERWTRAAMAVAAVLMLLAGVGAVLAGSGGLPARAQVEHEGNVIEILPGTQGFNPAVCQLNRNGSRVRFYNTDSVRRRIIEPGIGIDPRGDPLMDTGYIEPGEYSKYWQVQSVEDIDYEDWDNPALVGKIIAPLDPGAPDNCKPKPPTPTPTNTPIVTPTPTLTPTPTPQPTPYACGRFFRTPLGCAVAPQIATDEP